MKDHQLSSHQHASSYQAGCDGDDDEGEEEKVDEEDETKKRRSQCDFNQIDIKDHLSKNGVVEELYEREIPAIPEH